MKNPLWNFNISWDYLCTTLYYRTFLIIEKIPFFFTGGCLQTNWNKNYVLWRFSFFFFSLYFIMVLNNKVFFHNFFFEGSQIFWMSFIFSLIFEKSSKIIKLITATGINRREIKCVQNSENQYRRFSVIELEKS